MSLTLGELNEPLDEIELAKYKRMAIDARSGHFPTHLYGDRDHIEVLSNALERCAEALEESNAEEIVDNAKLQLEELEDHIDRLEETIRTIFKSAEGAVAQIQIRNKP